MLFRWQRVLVSDRKDLQICVVFQRVIQTNELPIHLDSIHLRMRDAARFDDILDRILFAQTAFNGSTAVFRTKKKIKVSVKIQPDSERIHI